MSRKFLICLLLLMVPCIARADQLLLPDALARYNEGLAFQKAGKDTEAVRSYKIAMMLMGNRADAQKYILNNMAVMAIQRGELNAAEELLRQVLAIDPAYKVGVLNLGLLYYKRGDPVKAIKIWSTIYDLPKTYLLENEKAAEEEPVFK